ncbi:uncharacterized protein AKAW2_21492S [Aspergillus luchuensis]|uniref:Uncharacterized protein n=2 Tax=Aspergillus kawachii TaxID=1069201 RepID=A0A1M3TXT7_ASPLC|nr:uncharacterized protein AKAW2_21492S [Aspergillus luchuensis]OJZ91617.1 hypothetical protein ASPFODRAFT_226351 [Aspergillus luchuensis CBS 106.47]BCR96552.1 hypothetical protein AKAW2_21492S [Aspergillus luchuensis]GAA82493.1 similar to An02g01410 [Aspergillus luchuensis IFO 4308]GAT26347.1 similar to An02g01410 [Aspergillus luchuensis]
MRPPMASSQEAQKTKNTPNGSASIHTTNARRKPLMDFSSLHPCSASMDDDDEDDEDSMQSSHVGVGSFSGVNSIEHSHSHSHPLSSEESKPTTRTQRFTPYHQPSDQSNSKYTKIPSGSESIPTSSTSAITTRLRSKAKQKSKSTTAHVHFVDQVDMSDTNPTTATSAPTNTNTNTKGSKSTEAAREETIPLVPRSRDLSLSESEISLLDIGPSLVYGDDGYIPLSADGYVRGHGHGQGDGGGVSVAGRGVRGLHLE